MTREDEDDEAVRGCSGCVVAIAAVGMAAASLFADVLPLSLLAVPVAATGSIIGITSRRTRPGRVAVVGGLVAVLLSVAAVLVIYGSAMAGLGGAG